MAQTNEKINSLFDGNIIMMQKLENARQTLEARTDRSAWSKGVTEYALELLEKMTNAYTGGWVDADQLATRGGILGILLNGASDWNAYSWGGSALIYNGDIAERLCTPSELKRTRGGERRPNSREEWLDTQARALQQAAARVIDAVTVKDAIEKIFLRKVLTYCTPYVILKAHQARQ